MTDEELTKLTQQVASEILLSGELRNLLRSMPEEDLAELAGRLSGRIASDIPLNALRKIKRAAPIRFLLNDEDINQDDNALDVGHAGPTLPDIVNIHSGTAWLTTGDGRELHLQMGAGSDCQWDAIASTCWADVVAAGRGTEGQTFTSLTGCTFKVYSTLNGAVQGMIAQGGHTKILLCNSETLTATIALTGLDCIRIFGLSSNPTGSTTTTSGSPVVITSALNTHFFTKAGDGASKNGNGIGFQGLSFVNNGVANILSISNASNLDWIEFEDCHFDISSGNGNIISGLTNLGLDFKVSNCTGRIDRFWVTTSSFVGVDNVYAFDNVLALTNFWQGSSPGTSGQSGRPDRAWFQGGRYSVTSETSLVNCDIILQFREMTIETTATVFTTAAEAQSCKDFVFQNLTIIATGASAKFANFGSHAGNFCQGLFIDGVFGYESSGINATGAFLTVEDTWQNVFIGTLNQYGWDSTYSGPAPTPGPGVTHTLLDASHHTDTAVDSVTRGSLIYGNSTPAWDELVKGTTGSVLYADANDAGWTINPLIAGYGRFGSTSTLTGATTAGDLTSIRHFIEDAEFNLAIVSSDPRIEFDTDIGAKSYFGYDRSGFHFQWVWYDTLIAAMGSTGSVAYLLQSGYARIGSASSHPSNTTAGDLTATRLFVPNVAVLGGSGLISQFGGPIGLTAQGAFRFYDTNNSNYAGLKANATTTADVEYTLPPAGPASNGYLLASTTAGVMSWAEDGSIAHIADTSDAHDASAISIADAGGYFAATEVEAALQEIMADGHELSITVENPTGAENIIIRQFTQAVTIVVIQATCVGGTSVTIDPEHGSAVTTATKLLSAAEVVAASNTSGEHIGGTGAAMAASFNDATLAAGDYLRLETTAISGTPTALHITFRYRLL